jgi:hypothetical protein
MLTGDGILPLIIERNMDNLLWGVRLQMHLCCLGAYLADNTKHQGAHVASDI